MPRKLQTGVIYHPVHGYPIPPPVPVAVARRNARERTRVKTVNDSYACLKSHVPAAARTKRMSKVDIIRHTIDYIQKLQKMISAPEGQEPVQQPHQTCPQQFAHQLQDALNTKMTQQSEHYFAQYPYSAQDYQQQPLSQVSQDPPTPVSPSYSVTSSGSSYSSFSSSPSPFQLPPKENQTYASEDVFLDDDILDVIAEWQDS